MMASSDFAMCIKNKKKSNLYIGATSKPHTLLASYSGSDVLITPAPGIGESPGTVASPRITAPGSRHDPGSKPPGTLVSPGGL
jgi:hypothetical protein